MMCLTEIRLLILDVDGVLTDGGLSFGPDGEIAKTFHARDGYAIRLWQSVGGKAAILSGRRSRPVEARAAELGIGCVRMGILNKLTAFEEILSWAGCNESEAAYVGDDLPDLPVMERCGFPVAVSDASPEVKRVARYITGRPGGRGAVAEVIELILRKQGRWSRSP